MSEGPIPENTGFEVLELNQTTEVVQAMEARGDFKFKGIFSVFNTILDWTTKFPSNGILPTADQLSRDNNVPNDKIKAYLKEMLGKGTLNTQFITYFPAVDFLAGPGANLVKMTVYCRPTKADGGTALRYARSYIEKNYKAVTGWIENKEKLDESEYATYLKQSVEQGRLPETQAGVEISRLFYTEYDDTVEKKRKTYNLFVRPLIRRLVDSQHLLYLQEKSASGEIVYKGVFYKRQDHLNVRLNILKNIFFSQILPGTATDDPQEFRELLNQARAKINSYSVGLRQVILELSLLSPAQDGLKKEEEEKKKKRELEQVLVEIQKSPRILDADRIKGINEDLISQLRSQSSVLFSEFPANGRNMRFILSRDSIPQAMKYARDVFEKTGNDIDIQVMISMNLERLLDADLLKEYQSLEQMLMFERLPVLVRMWRALFGNSKLKPEEAAKIKNEMIKKNSEELLKIQTAEAKKAQKKLVSERLKDKGKESADESPAPKVAPKKEEPDGFEPPDEKPDPAERSEEAVLAEKNEEKLKEMIVVLDRAWDQKELPNRSFLIEKFPEFDEDTLILFLKKYGRKEIYSFRIRNEKPDYQWPILISRKYIRKHGKKMLSDAIAKADEQRKALMPNQEKFDIYTAMEDFLTRVLTKN